MLMCIENTKFLGFAQTVAWDHSAYTQIKSKLLAKVKEDMQRNLVEQKLKEFEEYEKAVKNRRPNTDLRKKRMEVREQKKLEKQMKQQKKENGERAFRDWLRRSMGKCILKKRK